MCFAAFISEKTLFLTFFVYLDPNMSTPKLKRIQALREMVLYN